MGKKKGIQKNQKNHGQVRRKNRMEINLQKIQINLPNVMIIAKRL